MKCNLLNHMKLKKGCMEETGRQEAKKETSSMPMSRVQKKLFVVYSVLMFIGNVCDLRLCGRGSPVGCQQPVDFHFLPDPGYRPDPVRLWYRAGGPQP